jgi:hypothetical protein
MRFVGTMESGTEPGRRLASARRGADIKELHFRCVQSIEKLIKRRYLYPAKTGAPLHCIDMGEGYLTPIITADLSSQLFFEYGNSIP